MRRGCFVYDPFVGTGSLLVAAAALGATTLGADLDVRVVRDGKRGGDGQARSCPTARGPKVLGGGSHSTGVPLSGTAFWDWEALICLGDTTC